MVVDQGVQLRKVDLGFHNLPRTAAEIANPVRSMPPMVAAAAGRRPERACSRTIFCDLQACISEPVRIIHYALDGVRRLFCNRGTERGRESASWTAIQTVNTDLKKKTVSTTDEITVEKESCVAEYDDYIQQRADNGLGGAADDDDLNSGDDDDLHGSDKDDLSNSEDYEDGEEIDQEWPPPSLRIGYEGDSKNMKIAYSFSRYLVELLTVRPRFPFVGTFVASNDCSAYCFSSLKGHPYRYVDSKGNLILRAQGGAIEDGFKIRIEIPDDNNKIEAGNLLFTVDPYTCNKVITDTIPTIHCREIDVTFVPLYRAIQANVFVNLDLTTGGSSSTGGTICYVYGEITAHHQLYNDQNVMLFYRREEDKSEVIDGELPLLRPWAVVPVYLDPLLIIKLSLHVSTNPEQDYDGRIISFQGDLTFDRDQYEKTICNADNHGEVKVQITYQ